MLSVEYRRASEADIPGMVRVRNAGADHDGFLHDRIAQYMAGQHHPRHALLSRAVFIAISAGGVVGYAAGHLTRRHGCDGELQWMYVLAEYRGRGVGSGLLHQLVHWFTAQEAPRICVNVDPANAAARRFFMRYGAHDLNPHWLIWEDISTAMAPAMVK